MILQGLILSKLPQDFIICFGSNSTGNHGPLTAGLALKHFGAQMEVASGRQGQSYGIVTIVLKKGFTDPSTGIRYNKHFLMPTQMKTNSKDLHGYARAHPGLTFVIVYIMHKCSNPRLGPAHNACSYNSTQIANFFGSSDIWGVTCNVVFKDHFDRVVYSMHQA